MNLTRKSSWTRFMSNSTQLLVQRVADAAHDPTAWDGPAPGVLAVACSAGTTYTRSITAPSGSKHGAKSGSGLRGQPNSASTPSETSPADFARACLSTTESRHRGWSGPGGERRQGGVEAPSHPIESKNNRWMVCNRLSSSSMSISCTDERGIWSATTCTSPTAASAAF